jgi:hypothetical protein
MKMIASAVALAVLLALPAVGEAASTKKRVKSAKAPRALVTEPYARQSAARRTGKPCAAYSHAWGCLGWDPDPHVRSMIQMDSNYLDE